MRRAGIALIVGAVVVAIVPGASAQVPTRDTLRTRRDSLRADSLRMRGDTIRPRRDSVSVAVPPPPDSARADSVRRREIADSVLAAKLARRAADSIKAPLARSEVPPEMDIGAAYRWNRDQLFASGALTLGELLGRIPGITGFSSGWIATPHTNSYLGDFARIRVFFDGVELDPLDPRMGRRTICPEGFECKAPSAMLDFATVPIWTLEDLAVERAGEEVRVHMRSWRVDRTTPYTRADISTGDLATNSYRGFFGRRFGNGGALQVGAQQYSTEDPRAGGDGNQLDFLVRLGWAKKRWSVDAVGTRTRRSRTEQLSCSGIEGTDCSILFPDRPTNPATIPNIPGLDATRSEAYLRVSYGDAERSPWLQLIASTSRFAETNETRAPPSKFACFAIASK